VPRGQHLHLQSEGHEAAAHHHGHSSQQERPHRPVCSPSVCSRRLSGKQRGWHCKSKAFYCRRVVNKLFACKLTPTCTHFTYEQFVRRVVPYNTYVAICILLQLHIFDAINLCAVNTFIAHDGPLAALKFNPDGTMLATASKKGTVIRVYSVPQGARLFEFRRGMTRFENNPFIL